MPVANLDWTVSFDDQIASARNTLSEVLKAVLYVDLPFERFFRRLVGGVRGPGFFLGSIGSGPCSFLLLLLLLLLLAHKSCFQEIEQREGWTDLTGKQNKKRMEKGQKTYQTMKLM